MKSHLSLLASFMAIPAYAAMPTMNLNVEQITVSGISSGAYMAGQFHIANSDWVSGAGLIAGGPYYCGQNSIKVALAECVSERPANLDISHLTAHTESEAKNGKIASTENLKNSRLWMLHGTKDDKVVRNVSDALVAYYQNWVPQENIAYITDKPFAHVFPTMDYGVACDTSETPYLGNCDYDAAGEMLSHINSEMLNPPALSPSGKLHTIDQQMYGGAGASTLADEGYVYIPDSCASGQQCSVHVSFHGCNQYADAIGDAYATNTGLNRWADTNNLIVLYPQTKKSLFMPLNPQGCWDWWGYTDENYANQKGPQVSAVTHMIKTLANPG